MSPITRFAQSALIFSTAIGLTAALNMDQCNRGKNLGYWGSSLANTPNHGDIMTQTYCFCSKAEEKRTEDPANKDLGVLVQIEYYNKDHDTTFAFCRKQLCHHSNPEEQINYCFLIESENGVYSNVSHWHDSDYLVRQWDVEGHPNNPVQFSFVPNTHRFGNEHGPAANFMSFMLHERNLGPQGGQHYRKIENGVQDVCALQCKEFVNMDVATAKGSLQPSFQILNNLDNICGDTGCLNA